MNQLKTSIGNRKGVRLFKDNKTFKSQPRLKTKEELNHNAIIPVASPIHNFVKSNKPKPISLKRRKNKNKKKKNK